MFPENFSSLRSYFRVGFQKLHKSAQAGITFVGNFFYVLVAVDQQLGKMQSNEVITTHNSHRQFDKRILPYDERLQRCQKTCWSFKWNPFFRSQYARTFIVRESVILRECLGECVVILFCLELLSLSWCQYHDLLANGLSSLLVQACYLSGSSCKTVELSLDKRSYLLTCSLSIRYGSGFGERVPVL